LILLEIIEELQRLKENKDSMPIRSVRDELLRLANELGKLADQLYI